MESVTMIIQPASAFYLTYKPDPNRHRACPESAKQPVLRPGPSGVGMLGDPYPYQCYVEITVSIQFFSHSRASSSSPCPNSILASSVVITTAFFCPCPV